MSLLVASSDEQFRELIRENLLNQPNARLVSEYPEVASNLYIRVLHDLERHPEAALIVDLSSADPDDALKAVERVRQAAPDTYIIAASFSADGEHVIAAVRAGSNDFLQLPMRRSDFRDAMARLERAPRRTNGAGSRIGRIYAFVGTKGGAGTTTLAVNFASVLAQRKHQTVLL
ncbi:MAG TPA: hypothetical protein VFL57_15900, partial [Bryobacteraceae bacterium]|nr:hypothetical protein [Bryobacteraceae bacterium]